MNPSNLKEEAQRIGAQILRNSLVQQQNQSYVVIEDDRWDNESVSPTDLYRIARIVSIALQRPSSDATAEVLRDIRGVRSLAEIESIVESLQNDDETGEVIEKNNEQSH